MPAGLTTAPEAHDLWFRAKVLQALEALGKRHTLPHHDVIAAAQELIARKRRTQAFREVNIKEG